MMDKWADYLISAANYDSSHLLTNILIHKDEGGKIGPPEEIDRNTISSNIKNGKSYLTIFGSLSTWKKGEQVRTFRVDGEYFLRIDKNKVNLDNLGDLPTVESQLETISGIEAPKPISPPKPAATPKPAPPPKPIAPPKPPTPKQQAPPTSEAPPTPKQQAPPTSEVPPTPKQQAPPTSEVPPTPKQQAPPTPTTSPELDAKLKQLLEENEKLKAENIELKDEIKTIESSDEPQYTLEEKQQMTELESQIKNLQKSLEKPEQKQVKEEPKPAPKITSTKGTLPKEGEIEPLFEEVQPELAPATKKTREEQLAEYEKDYLERLEKEKVESESEIEDTELKEEIPRGTLPKGFTQPKASEHKVESPRGSLPKEGEIEPLFEEVQPELSSEPTSPKPKLEDATEDQIQRVEQLNEKIKELEKAREQLKLEPKPIPQPTKTDDDVDVSKSIKKQASRIEKIEKQLSNLSHTKTKTTSGSAEAYCVKCKAKRTIKDPQETTMKNGRAAIRGTCSTCGTKVFRIGKLKK